MIKSIMIINNHGKPRLTKFYEHMVRPFGRPGCALLMQGNAQDEATQQQVIREIFSLVSKRPDTVCNFLEGSTCVLSRGDASATQLTQGPRFAGYWAAPTPSSFTATTRRFTLFLPWTRQRASLAFWT